MECDINSIELVKTQKAIHHTTSEQTYFSNLYWLNCLRWYIFNSYFLLHFLACSVKCFICSVASRLLDSGVFVPSSHCVYFQIIYNTMDFYEWKLNLKLQMNYLQKDKWVRWSVGVWLTHHIIKFCTCNNSTPK